MARRILIFLLALISAPAFAQSDFWTDASAVSPTADTHRIPIATSSSSGPSYVTPLTLESYMLSASSNTHVQYNDSGGFGGEAAFSYNKTSNTLTLSNLASVAGENLAASATAPAATTGASQAGVAASVTASNAVASTDTAGAAAGGSVTITAGNAARLTSGNANGGDITLAAGAGIGTGTAGQVHVSQSGTTAKPALTIGAINFGFLNDGNAGLVFAGSGSNRVSLGSGGSSSVQVINGGGFGWNSSFNGALDTMIGRSAANGIIFGSFMAGAATTQTYFNKAVTGIADATATTVFTVTVPNAAHSASVEVVLTCSLGAGGAIGANEATGTVVYNVSVARTAGVNAVATISTAYGSSTSSVAGAATITVTGDLGAVSGAVGASNTFTIRATVSRGSGSSTNHTCVATARLLNANATGVTIS